MARERRCYSLDQSPFFRLATKRKLALVIGITIADMKTLARSECLYREFPLSKKSGGTRLVENPPHDLKKVQKRVARLLGRIRPKDYLFCPVKGRSYVSNASRHRGQRVIRCLDIRKYFPSTPAWRVYRFFRVTMQCATDVAEILTQLATYKGHLPTGSPLSPIMAYLAYLDVWEHVAAIADRHGWTLTVYVDDVTISGSHVHAKDLWEVKKAIHTCGLRYHKEKAYFGKAAEVTGVILRDGGLGPPNRQLRKLHQLKDRVDRLRPHERGDKVLMGTLKGLRGQLGQIRSASAS